MEVDLGPGESPQVRATRVTAIVAVILAVLVLIAFGFQTLFRDRIGQTYAAGHRFPPPAVIPNERAQRLALEARQNRDLNGAGGHMAVDAAIQFIVAKGPRAFDPVGGAP